MRGGRRIIYYFHSAEMPLFALTAFAMSRTLRRTNARTYA